MKTLDKDRPYSTVYGTADHAFEQDGLRFDRKGICIDPVPTKPARAGDDKPDAGTPPAKDPPAGEQTGGAEQETDSGAPIAVAALGLSTKVENALLGAGLDTVDKLCVASKSELLALPNIGDVAVKEIVKKLKALDRKLAG